MSPAVVRVGVAQCALLYCCVRVQVAMGQGQAGLALKLLHECANKGEWLCLKNLHLVTPWLVTLEKEINSLQPEQGFRLWLTTESHPSFPPVLLQHSLKKTFEVSCVSLLCVCLSGPSLVCVSVRSLSCVCVCQAPLLCVCLSSPSLVCVSVRSLSCVCVCQAPLLCVCLSGPSLVCVSVRSLSCVCVCQVPLLCVCLSGPSLVCVSVRSLSCVRVCQVPLLCVCLSGSSRCEKEPAENFK